MRSHIDATRPKRSFPWCRTATWFAGTVLLTAAGCGDDDDSTTDAAGDADVAAEDGSSDCTLEGTYTITSTEVLSGACDLELADDTLAIRRLTTGYLVDFDDTSWDDPVGSAATCAMHSDGPATWSFNGTLRRRTLTVTVQGEELAAEVTDRLTGADALGRTCDVRLRLIGRRTGPAPEGAAVGIDACGPLGCSASRCVFGQEFGCASGLCLLDSSTGWGSSFCTVPCALDTDCPTGFQCLEAYEEWYGAPAGRYCARWRAVCGNGLVESGETCDDGNRVDGDGCSADCSSDESCGNGILEADEFCEATHPEEWLPCTTTCAFDPPPGVATPLPVDSQSIVAASTGPRSFVVAAQKTLGADGEPVPLQVARTADGGATWTTGPGPSVAFWWLDPVSLTAQGTHLALGLTDNSEAFHLSESLDGGATWTEPTRHAIADAAVSTLVAWNRLELALLPDGALLALLGRDDGLLVARRAAGSADWTVATTVELCAPHGWTDGRLSWDPPRFRALDGGGVQAVVEGSHVTILAAGQCFDDDAGAWVHVTRAAGSADGGTTFAPPVDLATTAGLTNVTHSPLSPEPHGTAAVCLAGTTLAGERAMRCAFGPSDPTLPWDFFDTPVEFPDPHYSPAADAILAAGPTELLLARHALDATGGHVYRTTDGGTSWTTIATGEDLFLDRTLRRVGPDAAWLVEVDGNNELSLVRLDLAAGRAAERTWLFGDARRGDGSGMPWRTAWADDGAGAGVLGFSLPDPLRYWTTVVRPMD